MREPSAAFQANFSPRCSAKSDDRQMILMGRFRFTILTPRLLRVEEDVGKQFTDAPTQVVWFRDFDAPTFRSDRDGNDLVIRTQETIFRFDLSAGWMRCVTLKNGTEVTDFIEGNLYGTARTLDGVNGKTKLSSGLMSRGGVTVLDDQNSCLLRDDGSIAPRPKTRMDRYFFAYGTDFRGCLRDFFRLTGAPPLVPRFCLGNWWSRYKDYTQAEYKALMQEFLDREIPITVATIDMDWHWVNVLDRFGAEVKKRSDDQRFSIKALFQGDGWTGYSWNTELFPDHRALLDWLNSKGFKVTLNLHPAQGVRFFEDRYEEMARAMGIDPATKKPVKFDIADPTFVEAYFDILHRPTEREGVRFWWIDWQQEKTTKIKGLDPLWALNHYHTLAFRGTNLRPLILSRYAGPGSHRYPLGFSGDTVISWKSLAFQPYFTANASNVGYTWWSHDIGGHMMGVRDDELYARWVQLGEFSPIMRLHSTKDPFMGKEPWTVGFAAQQAAINALRERHALIPYLYSANDQTHRNGRALIEPMYYAYPDEDAAYQVPNQFFFGDALMVCPITQPADRLTGLASVKVWLPAGRWTDWYDGRIYDGGRFLTVYRGIEHLPVFARAGAIVPLSDDDRTNDCGNPAEMTLRIFRGTGRFELYEDDGETMAYTDGAWARTVLRQREAGRDLGVWIESAEGDLGVLPESRSYTLVFDDIEDAALVSVRVGGRKRPCTVRQRGGKLELSLLNVSPEKEIEVRLCSVSARKNRPAQDWIVRTVSRYQMPTLVKTAKFGRLLKDPAARWLQVLPAAQRGPIEEILALRGV